MKRYLLTIFIVGLFAVSAFAQGEQTSANQSPAQAAPEVAAPAPAQPQEVSIYGEVKAVNMAANTISIQYYDYDSDEEKSIDMTTDKDTKMENAAVITDIKPGNWADVIYSVKDAKNVAKSIIVEKEEEAPAEPAKIEEMAPAPAAPKQ